MPATHSFGVGTRQIGDAGIRSRTGLVGKLSGLPEGIDLLKLPLSDNQHTTIISAYAITMTSQMMSKLSSTMLWIVLFLQYPSNGLIIRGDRKAGEPELAQTTGLGRIDRISGNWQMQR